MSGAVLNPEFPKAARGQSVGLLGGSFDPPHRGHVHITTEALKRFGLDRVWWLVTPGNPLKEQGPAPLAQRMQQARAIMQHPKVTVTDIEARLGTRYTAQTLAALRRQYPGVNFVWLMGADNLAQFHKWQDWRTIMMSVPVGVLARPGIGYRHACHLPRACSHLTAFRGVPRIFWRGLRRRRGVLSMCRWSICPRPRCAPRAGDQRRSSADVIPDPITRTSPAHVSVSGRSENTAHPSAVAANNWK